MSASEPPATEPPQLSKCTSVGEELSEAKSATAQDASTRDPAGASTPSLERTPGDISASGASASRSSTSRRGTRRQAGVREIKKSPIATAGAIAGIIALFPLSTAAVHVFTDDDIGITQSPISFTTGQESVLSFVVPESADEERARPAHFSDSEDFQRWAAENGGVRAQDVELSFVARSDNSAETLITAVRVVVLEREPALAGTWFGLDAGGPKPNRIVYANLDSSPPSVTRSLGWSYPLSISSSDAEAFTIVVTSEECYCLWRVEVDAITPDGDKVTVLVDDDGDPFELTGTDRASDRTSIQYK